VRFGHFSWPCLIPPLPRRHTAAHGIRQDHERLFYWNMGALCFASLSFRSTLPRLNRKDKDCCLPYQGCSATSSRRTRSLQEVSSSTFTVKAKHLFQGVLLEVKRKARYYVIDHFSRSTYVPPYLLTLWRPRLQPDSLRNRRSSFGWAWR